VAHRSAEALHPVTRRSRVSGTPVLRHGKVPRLAPVLFSDCSNGNKWARTWGTRPHENRVCRGPCAAPRKSAQVNAQNRGANLEHDAVLCRLHESHCGVLFVDLAPVCHSRYRDKPRGIIDEINDSPVTDSNAPLIPVAS